MDESLIERIYLRSIDNSEIFYLLDDLVEQGYDYTNGLAMYIPYCSGMNTSDILFLLKQGADPNILVGVYRDTPLIYSAIGDRTDIMKLLIDYDADIDALDSNGCNAFQNALSRGRKKAALLLMNMGADINRGNIFNADYLAILGQM